MKTRWIILGSIFLVFFIIFLIYMKNGISNLDTRVADALTVFSNPEYDTGRADIPINYYNEYYKKDMPLYACDFYWASSRKSYLPAGESFDLPSKMAIEKVLRAGARVINLDIYPNNAVKWDMEAYPVVRASTKMPIKGDGVELTFSDCVDVIKKTAWLDNADYPLVLFLDIHYNELLEEDCKNPYLDKNVFLSMRIADIVHKKLGERLVDKKYGFNGRNGMYKFSKIPMKDLLGKVAILTNVYPTHGVLDELINGTVSEKEDVLSLLNYNSDYQQYGGIAGQHIQTKDMIEHNRLNMTVVNNEAVLSFENIYNPKSDLYNPPISDTNKYGCQMTLMNYQLFDDNMKEYLKMFSKSSLVLKPDDLRYIPKPPPPIREQSVPNYFAKRTVETPGWFSLDY